MYRIPLILLLAASVSFTAAAQPYSQPANPDSALQTVLRSLEGFPLALSDAIRLAMDQSTDVRTAEAAYRAARGAARREAGVFDPVLFVSFNELTQRQPAASFFSGANVLSTTQRRANAGLRIRLPIGTDIEASLNTTRLETNSSFAFLNPQYDAFGNITIRQPLLGGLYVSARKNAERTDLELEAAKARYDQQVLAIRTAVENKYWDLYAAARDYAVQRVTRDRAEALLKETELRASTGLIGPNQVANARTFLAEQEILLLDREEFLDRVSDELSSFIGTRPEGTVPRFTAVDTPPAETVVENIDLLVQQGLEKNLEVQAAHADVEARRALANAGFWEALPKLDFVGSIGGSGLAGDSRAVIFGDDTLRTTRGGSYGDAVSQAIRRLYPSWSVGLELNVPIGLRSGLGEQERLEAEVLIAEQRMIHQERILEEHIRASYRELENGQRRLVAAKEGVDAAQEQVRIGLIEFQNGRTTAFELVRLGADFAVAQQRYSQALVRSAKAAATLRQLTSGAYSH